MGLYRKRASHPAALKVPKKITIHFNSEIPLLGISPKKEKAVSTKEVTRLFRDRHWKI